MAARYSGPMNRVGMRDGCGVYNGSEVAEAVVPYRQTRAPRRRSEPSVFSSESEQAGALLLDVLIARTRPGRRLSARALRRLVDSLSVWAPRLLRHKFHPAWIEGACDDAIQHLLLAVTEGKADHLARVDNARAAGWMRRVLMNFAYDQIRCADRVVRGGHLATEPCGEMIDTTIDAQRRFSRLVEELKRVALCTASPRTAVQRADLIQDYFASLLVVAGESTNKSPRNTFDQRRSRGRRAAIAAWLVLRDGSILKDFGDMAAGLGLEPDRQSSLLRLERRD